MPLVSVTRLRVRSWLYLPPFLLASLRIGRQAARAPGNLAAKVLNDRQKTFWTSTSWESEPAMKAFMHGAPHGPAMRKLLDWCDEAALVHWAQDSAELPSWIEAHRRMQEYGRRSKVNRPSEAQAAFRIAPPADLKREFRFK